MRSTRSSAAAVYDISTARSLSCRSTDTHANWVGSRCAHSASSVVLP